MLLKMTYLRYFHKLDYKLLYTTTSGNINKRCNRKLDILRVGWFTSRLTTLTHLILSFNTDLIQDPINKNKGSIAFIDDFIAWVIGDTIAKNIEKLQSSIILHLKNAAY